MSGESNLCHRHLWLSFSLALENPQKNDSTLNSVVTLFYKIIRCQYLSSINLIFYDILNEILNCIVFGIKTSTLLNDG